MIVSIFFDVLHVVWVSAQVCFIYHAIKAMKTYMRRL